MRKLTYEQMRLLSSVGADNQKIQIKNNKGKVLKALPKKWHSPKETLSSCFQVQPKQYHARQDPHSQTYLAPSYLPHPQLRAKR